MNTRLGTILSVLVLSGVSGSPVRTGLDRVAQVPALFQGKRVGVIANRTSVDSQGRFVVQVLQSLPHVTVTALFAPEHGLWGTEPAGAQVRPIEHPDYRIPVHSLYGTDRKPTGRMLGDVDVLVFDIQDIGTRFYTYIWTMALAMEAAAESNKAFVVLDRPNPLTGIRVEGTLLDPAFSSFLGLHPIPVVHGMTIGELARMFNEEGWLAGGVRADLTVVRMEGWSRAMWFDRTGLEFIRPSPNIPDLETAIVYPGLALFEGTNVSEGRGTPAPFRQFGAPWIDPQRLAERLNGLSLPGLAFEPVHFTPVTSKYSDQPCHGVRATVLDRDRVDPFFSGVRIVREVSRMYPDRLEWDIGHFDRLCGTDAVRRAIEGPKGLDPVRGGWERQVRAFLGVRQGYLMYR